MGTTILYSESRREEARRSVDIYLNPELAGVGLLDWKQFDRIVELGYRHAKEVLAGIPEQELALYRNPFTPPANAVEAAPALSGVPQMA
jgi:NTE family protein